MGQLGKIGGWAIDHILVHPPCNDPKEFYRFIYHRFGYVALDMMDDSYYHYTGEIEIEVEKWYLHSETPKGYWIGYKFNHDKSVTKTKWVSKTARKRFAYPTMAEAWINLKKRTQMRSRILKTQTEEVEEVLRAIEEVEKEKVKIK